MTKAMQIAYLWPFKLQISLPCSTSHNFTVASNDALQNKWPKPRTLQDKAQYSKKKTRSSIENHKTTWSTNGQQRKKKTGEENKFKN